jgi:heme exporter protein D
MGHVIGGWDYVWGAYAVTWFGLVAFAVSLYVRRSKEQS